MKRSKLTSKETKLNTIINVTGYVVATCIMLLLFTIVIHIIKNPDSIHYAF